MEIIYNKPEIYATNDIWIQPVSRSSVLDSNVVGTCKIIHNIPVLKTLGSPSLKRTVLNILHVLKDKMTFFKNSSEIKGMDNIFEYLNEIYFDKSVNNYYRAKKAWYRVIGDLFEDVNNWNFKKVMGKLITILKVLNPVLVFDLHDISKWNHLKTFQRFVRFLKYEGISIVLRCPFEAYSYLKNNFEDYKTNSIAAVIYYAKKKGNLISEKVSKELLKLSSGNLKVIDLILANSKRDLKNLRDLKVNSKRILPEVVPKKYKNIVEKIILLKKFNIKEISAILEYSQSTVYNYLNELVEMNIIKKRRLNKNILFKLNIDKKTIRNIIKSNFEFKNIFFEINNSSLKNYTEMFNGFLIFG
ncbi:transcriptional regulator, ArsR family [Methanococcus maripaludis C5]|uniref:Transcriptional regulator, ArsR family n=1 Tax=Methanococcus maripaludis (strain C5 / ATCC BAA-1333) TaxID=402880 RepID=A4G0G2_METM5|nr:helix-turn-helix domain-containing protein [Methanococcus maripaludis]ABO35946.1 transcriptional regulator, ArsR family [Methanococcus maripaludis C5]